MTDTSKNILLFRRTRVRFPVYFQRFVFGIDATRAFASGFDGGAGLRRFRLHPQARRLRRPQGHGVVVSSYMMGCTSRGA